MQFPEKLNSKIELRKKNNALRRLGTPNISIDFSSNDYLGFANSKIIFEKTHQFLSNNNLYENGATGSRLLSGNHSLYNIVESQVAKYHNSPSALIFNSGYTANLGFFSTIPQKGDVIVYDAFIHASIRDGMQLSNAKNYKFKHNNIADLEKLLERISNNYETIYIVTESVFSMDGDTPNLKELVSLSKKYINCYIVVDEAHALGVLGDKGVGFIQNLDLEKDVFARIITFGKGLGCHGAAILGSEKLTEYLLNFSRSFIYTTGLSPHSLATIKIAYENLNSSVINELQNNIKYFNTEVQRLGLQQYFIKSNSAIHCCVVSGTAKTKRIAAELQEKGFNIKPILSPTVAKGKERLRFCLHSYNSFEEITKILEHLSTLITP